ncbi:MAG: thioredoxin [Gammaproteobacteria bacterium]|nr:thioredoxin [Gammaproteobacteria bacterium]
MTRLPEPVPAPDFALEDMDGETHRLSDLRGQVVMVNFWATWCPPCREEMPSMEAVYQGLKGEGFQVLAVNQWESPDQVFPYMGQLDVYPSFPVLFDRDSSVAEAYGVKGLPTTVLIDPQGRVVYRAVGGRNFNHPEVQALIRGLMESEE